MRHLRTVSASSVGDASRPVIPNASVLELGCSAISGCTLCIFTVSIFLKVNDNMPVRVSGAGLTGNDFGLPLLVR